MKQDKIYYNTEYRKQIKALSKFNIFIKDRIEKKDVIQEVKLKKKIKLLGPLIYKNLYSFYKLIKNVYNLLIYKIRYNLELSLEFVGLNYFLKKKNYFFFKNQLVLEYFFNGIIYFFLIVNWLWTNEWNKWASFTDILEYNFFNINVMLKFINFYFFEFIDYLFKSYKILLFSIFYDLNNFENTINVYNIYLFNSLDLFYVLYNVEEIRLEHEKNFVKKEKWKDIRKVSFSYFNIDLLNNYSYLSFFSFSIYEFFLRFDLYNMQYITLTFFDYWVDYIIEDNNNAYTKLKKVNNIFNFQNNNLNNLFINIFKDDFFPIRVKYNLFISNIDYFIFVKNFTYNFYIRNYNYFFEFTSHKKLFLKYNNPVAQNKGTLTLWSYSKLKNRDLLLYDNINEGLNLFNMKKNEPFYNFVYKNYNSDLDYIKTAFLKDFNIKFLYKLNKSDRFFFSVNKFFFFNLMDFYNLKNKLESYKDVMAIKSVYEYRFANSAFKTINEFIFTIFKTPLENYIYFDEFNRNFSYNIVLNIFKSFEKKFFFKDLYNIANEQSIKFYLTFLRFFNRVTRIRSYFFKFYYLWNLIYHEKRENLLKIDVFSRFYYLLKKKKLFSLMHKLNKENFYKQWSIKSFFKIIKDNTMFYLDIYSMSILYNGWIYESLFFSRIISFTKIYNKFIKLFQLYDSYKYIMSFKDFFFQLMYENIEYVLIFIFLNNNKIKKNYNYNFLNKKNEISNNFIYRKYMLYTWLKYDYYSDVFDDLEFFEKENYSIKLSKWILRYFYDKAELYQFYSESLDNNYINKNRLFF